MTVFFWTILTGTFLLEDVALTTALLLYSQNKISLNLAFQACFWGIALGDLALYGLGYLASHKQIRQRFQYLQKVYQTNANSQHTNQLSLAIIASRFIPGTRLPTYLLAGLSRFSVSLFVLLTLISVFAWVALAFIVGHSLRSFFAEHWLLLAFGFLSFFYLYNKIVAWCKKPWLAKAFVQSWRQWLHFEFWPAWFFYIPLFFYYLYLSFKYRSPLRPFYAHPHLKHGGLIGESKWELLCYLDKNHPATLFSQKINASADWSDIQTLLAENKIAYPFVIKPDVGQRGYGVRIIHNETEGRAYLQQMPASRIIQRLSDYQHEAGVFYIRLPNSEQSFIFSVTDKYFPFVVGNGIDNLERLILNDPRARIIANTYLQRHENNLNLILASDQRFFISECGNHCQGAIFKNGQHLITAQLLQEIDKIARQIPDFYFGRFDIRYRDQESLKKGQFFDIIEINGAGSEATHIWDPDTTLLEAYQTLFTQWDYLFRIGLSLSKTPGKQNQLNLLEFIRECCKLIIRKGTIRISS